MGVKTFERKISKMTCTFLLKIGHKDKIPPNNILLPPNLKFEAPMHAQIIIFLCQL